MSYVQPTFPSDYNNPTPVDDGSQTVPNQLSWQRHIDRIGDPIKEFSQNVDANVATEFGFQYGNAVGTFSTTTTFTGSERGSLQRFTGSSATTGTLASAASVGVNNSIAFVNSGSATLTIDTQNSETINGASSITLTTGQSVTLFSDGSNWYIPAANAGLDAGFRTGDIKTTTRDVDTGWLNMDGFTFGDASTGGDNESANYEALFKHLYQKIAEVDAAVLEPTASWFAVDSFTNATNVIGETAHGLLDTNKIVFLIGTSGVIPTGLLPRQVYFVVNKNDNDFQVSLTSGGSVVAFSNDGTLAINVAKLDKTGSSSANADTDWAAGKTMIMPDARSKVPIGAGQGLNPDTGALLTSRALGDTGGVETHTLTTAESAAHAHLMYTALAETPGSTTEVETTESAARVGGPSGDFRYRMLKGTGSILHGINESVGGGGAHENMPPFIVMNIHIKI